MKSILLTLVICVVAIASTEAQFKYHLAFEKAIGGLGSQTAPYGISESNNSLMIHNGFIYSKATLKKDTSINLLFKGNAADIFVQKIDSVGTILWQKLYGSSDGENAPALSFLENGNLSLTFRSLGKDSDITCYYLDSLIPTKVNISAQAFELIGNGAIVKKKCFGSPARKAAIQQCLSTSDNGYLIWGTCNYLGDSLNQNYVLVKCDSLMNEMWHYCIDKDSISGGTQRIYEVENNNFIISLGTGSSATFYGSPTRPNDIGLLKFDYLGNLLWAKAFGSGGIENLIYLKPSVNGTIIFTGYTDLNGSSDSGDVHGFQGKQDMWIVKLDSMGAILRQKCIGSAAASELASCIIDIPGGGYFLGGLTFSNIIEGDTLGNHGQDDAFVAELDSNFNYIKGHCYGGSGKDNLVSVALHPDGSIWGWGQTNSIDGDVSFNHGLYDLWLIRLVPDTILGIKNEGYRMQNAVQIFPNPAKSELTIQFKVHQIAQEFLLLDARGKLLLQKQLNTLQSKLDVSELANGVYVLSFKYSNGQVLRKKVVVLH